jgi:hypothetical protein
MSELSLTVATVVATAVMASTMAPSHAAPVAAPTARAQITGVTLVVMDLNPTDGIVASATFSEIASSVEAHSDNLANANGDGYRFTITRRRDTAEALAAVMPPLLGFMSAASAWRGGGLAADMSATVYLPDLNNIAANSKLAFDFLLSGKSSLTVSGLMSSFAAIPEVGRDVPSREAAAVANSIFSGPLVDLGGRLLSSSSGVTPLSSSATASDLLPFSFTFENLSSLAQPGRIDFSVSAGAINTVAVVPEPKTYALMLAGVVVLAGFARAKRA